LWEPVVPVEQLLKDRAIQVFQVTFTVSGHKAAVVEERQEQRSLQQCSAKTEVLEEGEESTQVRRVMGPKVLLAETAARPYLLLVLAVEPVVTQPLQLLVTVGPEDKGHQTLIQVFR
tara:strand:+ start:220 stop:570 length:351 start_codon:yes stop_codon:yes gene_type:complete